MAYSTYVPTCWERQEDITMIYPPAELHTHTVILLHDRHQTAEEFGIELFDAKDSADCNIPALFPGFKWILPTFNVLRSVNAKRQGIIDKK
jgi:hypothetical protein